jgi:hypothetical protein
MVAMPDQLDTSFQNMSHADIIIKVESIADILANHSGFPLPWPDVVPNPQELKELVANFRVAVNAAAHGDRQRIAERDSTLAEMKLSATLTAQYLVMKSIKEKDPSLLNNTGFAQKNRNNSRSASHSNVAVGAPAKFTAKHGPVSGTVIARSSKVPGGGTYELQMCQGDQATEESWKTVGLFMYCSRMEVKDLEPAKRFSFRVRCHGTNGPGPWSSPVILIVI